MINNVRTEPLMIPVSRQRGVVRFKVNVPGAKQPATT
jgi:hypothetical protein